MTATILLVRHAAHDHLGRILSGRMPGVPLSGAGRAQAAALGARLSAEPLRAIQSSPVQRARETADAIAAAAGGCNVTQADALDEIDFGGWTGATFAALEEDAAWRHWNAARSQACPPGGETMAQAGARLMRHAAALAARHDGAMIALVSHCDVIRAAVAGWLGLSLDHALRFDIDPASVSRIAMGEWGARVMTLNERAA